MSRNLSVACFSLSIASLVGSYWSGDVTFVVVGLVSFWLIWLAGEWRRWVFARYFGYLGALSATMIGAILGLGSFALIISLTSIIISWDLMRFQQRLEQAEEDDAIRGYENSHLLQLAIFALISVATSYAATQLQIRIRFGQAVLFVIFGLTGFIYLVRILLSSAKTRQESHQNQPPSVDKSKPAK